MNSIDSLKEEIKNTLKETLDFDFDFAVPSNVLLKDLISSNTKTVVAAVINATEINKDTGGPETKYGWSSYSDIMERLESVTCQNMNWLLDNDELIRINELDVDDYPKSHLLQVSTKDIINVEMEGLLPRSITFSHLKAPILSFAFQGIIDEIRFGDPGKHLFNSVNYDDTRFFLEEHGVILPDNVYQTHYFMVYIQEFIAPEYINKFMEMGLDNGLTGIFQLINKLQELYGKKTYISDELSYSKDIISLEQISDEVIKKIATSDGLSAAGPTDGCLVISTCHYGADHYGLLFNKEKNKYMGVYSTDNEFYRSVADFINSKLSEPTYFLILAAYRTFVNDNSISISDGLDFRFDEFDNLILTTEGFDFSSFEALYPDGYEFTKGWEGSVPW